MAMTFKGSSNFKLKLTAVEDGTTTTYGGCAADISGNWNTASAVQVKPESCQTGDPEYAVFFGDTEGELTLSNLIFTAITAPTSSEVFIIDLSSAITLEIEATVGDKTYTMKFNGDNFKTGEGLTTKNIADNVYYVKTYTFKIFKDNTAA